MRAGHNRVGWRGSMSGGRGGLRHGLARHNKGPTKQDFGRVERKTVERERATMPLIGGGNSGCRAGCAREKNSAGWSAVTRAQSGRREVEVGGRTWRLPRWSGCPSEVRELQQVNSWAGTLKSSLLDPALSRIRVHLKAMAGKCQALYGWAGIFNMGGQDRLSSGSPIKLDSCLKFIIKL